MDDSIRHLRCTCVSLSDDRAEAAGIAARLDRIARTELATRYSTALDGAIGTQPDVWVLRRVESTAAVARAESLSDTAIADLIGRRMAVAVVRTISADPGDGANLVRFASHAEFVARFVIALLQGTASNRWYFFPFRAHRDLPSSQAIRTVLVDNRECLADVLAILNHTRSLERLLRLVRSVDLDAVWSVGLRDSDSSRPEAFRALFAAATTLIDRLGLWSQVPPSVQELDALFRLYLETQPAAVEWNDRRALALVVLEIVRFFAARRLVRSATGEVDAPPRFPAAVADLDWLDRDYLIHHLPQALSRAPRHVSLTVRELTPRQQTLVADLRELIVRGSVVLDGSEPAGTANRLRLFSALVARAPQWANDEFARTAVDNILVAWAWLEAAAHPDDIIDRLRRGSIEHIATSQTGVVPHEKAVAFIATILGTSIAADVLGTLRRGDLAHRTSPHADTEAEENLDFAESHLSTNCAGIFLLSRAVLDAHLPSLVQSVASLGGETAARLDILLASIALRWAGADGLSIEDNETYVDDAISLFAGLDRTPTLDELRAAWSEADTAPLLLQEGVLATLAALRAVNGSLLHIHEVPIGASVVLIAGVDAADLWPLSAIATGGSPLTTIRGWLDAWTAAFGHAPVLVVNDDQLHRSLTAAGLDAVLVSKVVSDAGDTVSDVQQSYDRSRRALYGALESISAGQLGVLAADLTIGFVALSLLRLWARWLGGFATSTAPYLLDRFIRRGGFIDIDGLGLTVTLASRPLDVVIEMAGYFAAVERIPWLGDRRLQFERAVP